LLEASISPLDERCFEVKLIELDELILHFGIHIHLEVSVQGSPVIEIAIKALSKHFTNHVTCS